MSEKRTSLEEYFAFGLDIQGRRIYFGHASESESSTEVNAGTVQLALRGIDKLLAVSNKPIELIVSSFGGCPYAALVIVDKMLESPAKFVFKGYGAIMSSATILMCAADERLLAKNATVMLHNGSDSLEGRTTDIEISVEEGNRLQDVFVKIYAENSHLDQKFYKTICKRDLFITSEETLQLGLADAIIEHKKRGSLRNGARKTTFSKKPTKKQTISLIDKLSKRIQLDLPKDITIHSITEESEVIEQYDNTDKLLDKKEDDSL